MTGESAKAQKAKEPASFRKAVTGLANTKFSWDDAFQYVEELRAVFGLMSLHMKNTYDEKKKASEYDPKLWYIHGNAYDLKDYVKKHPGGSLAILSAQGRDCTALFESYHWWNDNNRKLLARYGEKPPPCEPVYEEMKHEMRKLYPKGPAETKLRPTTVCGLLLMNAIAWYLFFVVGTYLSCLASGVFIGLFTTRLTHEAGHLQCSRKSWVNRLLLFVGYIPIGPSLCWYYRHVISHHPHTNDDHDVDVESIALVDCIPKKFNWMKIFLIPGVFAGADVTIGLATLFDMFAFRNVGNNYINIWIGQLIPETIAWFAFHYLFGPSFFCYVCMWFVSGALFVTFSQIAHAVVYPDAGPKADWAEQQIRACVNFAPRSSFWYHVAFGLTTQTDHHLFPGVSEHLLDDVHDEVVKPVCKKHKIPVYDVSAMTALGFLKTRLMSGRPVEIDAWVPREEVLKKEN